MRWPIRLLYPLFFAVLLIPSMLFSFIYEVKVLKKWIPERGDYRYVIGCCDFHDRVDPSNRAQRQGLDELLSLCDRAQTHVVVEDLATGSQDNTALKGRFLIISNGGVLGGLAGACTARGVPVTNVEYRYCRVAAIGPVIHNLSADYYRFGATRTITAKNIVDEFMQHAQSLGSDARSCAVLKAIQLKRLQAAGGISMADYLRRYTGPTNRFTVLKTLLTFDSTLLDIAILQAIAGTDKKYVLTVAGGSHIERVADSLQKEGYQVMYANTPKFKREYAMGSCLQQEAEVDGKSYCVKPRPLKPRRFKRLLEKYLSRSP